MRAPIDQTDRFEPLREAVCRVVLLEGAGALTTQNVASAMFTSLSTLKRLVRESTTLPVLGMQLVARRRAERTVPVGRADVGWPSSRRVLLGQVPVTEESAVEAVVWTRLVGRYAAVDSEIGALEDARRARQRALVTGILRELRGETESTRATRRAGAAPGLSVLAETAEVTLEGLVARVAAAPESWPLARRVLDVELDRWATLARTSVAE